MGLAQADALTLPVVVSRLINARRHLLALRIATLLGMGPEKARSAQTCSAPVFGVHSHNPHPVGHDMHALLLPESAPTWSHALQDRYGMQRQQFLVFCVPCRQECCHAVRRFPGNGAPSRYPQHAHTVVFTVLSGAAQLQVAEATRPVQATTAQAPAAGATR